jgi:2-oxoisovalerate dehydrogenase E2 component (dihydrolipoyl transacylase)
MNIFHLPDLGEGLAEAEIHEWFVKVGDLVTVDQPLVSLETAKAVVEVPAVQSGKIAKLYGDVGDIIKTHAPLLAFEETTTLKDQGSVVGRLEESESVVNEESMIIGSASKTQTATIKAMPNVRALAKQLNVNLNEVTPSGAQGQITLDDVKKHSAQTAKLPGKVEAVHSVRRFMAITTAEAHKEIAAVTIIDDADITDISHDADYTVRLIQAIIAGAQAEPSLNAWFDNKNMERCLHTEVHLGLAMDTVDGLFVPVLKDIAKQTAEQLREKINIYKKSVRSRTISPSDLQGATITLSNFGMIAGRYATPMIVPPMVAILGAGKIRDVPGVHHGQIMIRRIIPLSLTFDHRAVTGGEASRFLAAVIQHLEKDSSV